MPSMHSATRSPARTVHTRPNDVSWSTTPSVSRSIADWSVVPITVKRGASIGSNATILAGVTIGEDTVVGAGAVVTRDLPPGVVAYGNPARVQRPIGDRDRVEVP